MSSTWSEDAERKKERKERLKVRNEKLAGYFFDLSKLSFAGLVIGVFIPMMTGEDALVNLSLLITGIFLSLFLAAVANNLLK